MKLLEDHVSRKNSINVTNKKKVQIPSHNILFPPRNKLGLPL